MSRRWKQVVVAVVLVFAAAQLIRPDRTNPPIDASRTIGEHTGAASQLTAILDRSCGDCHSNNTVWPRYAQVAPVSWLWAYGVAAGRKAVNYSDWGSYTPEMQRTLLSASCDDVLAGKMPG